MSRLPTDAVGRQDAPSHISRSGLAGFSVVGVHAVTHWVWLVVAPVSPGRMAESGRMHRKEEEEEEEVARSLLNWAGFW